MKFDKFMNFCFKGLCLCLACFILAGFCVSCFHSPVKAHADSVDPVFMAQQADNYFRQVEQQMINIENAVLTDIKNGNISATSALGKQYMQAVALQMACIYSPTFQTVYHASQLVMQGLPDDIFDNPSEISVGVSGGSFLYYNYENELKSCFCSFTDSISSSGTHVLVFSPDFKIYFTSTGESSATYSFEYYNGSSWESVNRCGLGFNAIYSGAVTEYIEYPNGQFNNMSLSYNAPVSLTNTYIISRSSIPHVTNFNSFSNITIGGLGGVVSVPAENIESDRPYDYYNNVVLPYIHNQLPDVPDSVIVFPYGWHPQEPTEPPTIPNGGIYIDKQFNIGINIITPTDSNGQPVTDASGETVTETVYLTETYPPDGDYRFQLPTLDTLTMYQATVPYPDISSFTGGFAFLWNCVDHFFNDTGFMPVVIACLSMSVLAYVLWKVGG